MRIDLGNGDWAEVLDVADLRSGDRKAVNRSINIRADEDNRPILPGDYSDNMEDALLARICNNWSLQLPPPSEDKTSLDKLTLSQEKALRAGIQEHLNLVREDDESGPKSPSST